MKALLKFAILPSLILLVACTPKPATITYGSDGCHFCSMTIVDEQHAAQIVTKKGKPFKFDAIECMMNHLKDTDTSTIALYLVNDYEAPGEFINARNTTFLISKDIPSPMGEYLSAFKTESDAMRVETENKGKLYTWEVLLEKFKVQ